MAKNVKLIIMYEKRREFFSSSFHSSHTPNNSIKEKKNFFNHFHQTVYPTITFTTMSSSAISNTIIVIEFSFSCMETTVQFLPSYFNKKNVLYPLSPSPQKNKKERKTNNKKIQLPQQISFLSFIVVLVIVLVCYFFGCFRNSHKLNLIEFI